MKTKLSILLVGLIIGASYIALNSDSLNLKKEVNPPHYDKDLS